MFAGQVFYHGITKNTITAFVRLFSDIQVARQNSAGTIEQTIAVPIAYSNKEKAIQRNDADPKLTNQTRVSLPRLAFEIHGYTYDASRKMNRMNQLVCNYPAGTPQGRKQVFAPVPYNIDISLYIVTKTQEDGLQILEQIAPFFAPEYTLSLNVIPEMNIVHDVPVILNSVSVEDNAVGSYEDSRIVIHTLSFTMKTVFYGPVTDGKIIKHVTADVIRDGIDTTMEIYHADGTVPLATITESWDRNF